MSAESNHWVLGNLALPLALFFLCAFHLYLHLVVTLTSTVVVTEKQSQANKGKNKDGGIYL